MRAEPNLTEEMFPFDDVPDGPMSAPELQRYALRSARDNDEFEFRSLAECPERVCRAYWRRLQAA